MARGETENISGNERSQAGAERLIQQIILQNQHILNLDFSVTGTCSKSSMASTLAKSDRKRAEKLISRTEKKDKEQK